MNKQQLGNVVAGILFVIFSIVHFSNADQGLGTTFIILGAIYLGLALSGKRKPKASK